MITKIWEEDVCEVPEEQDTLCDEEVGVDVDAERWLWWLRESLIANGLLDGRTEAGQREGETIATKVWKEACLDEDKAASLCCELVPLL